MARPEILIDLVEALKKANFTASESVGGEGRAGSLLDEGNIIDWLKQHKKFSKYLAEHSTVFPQSAKSTTEGRKVGDFLIRDYNTDQVYVVNIKTTGGSCDNVCSKQGLLVALTDIPYPEIPTKPNWIKIMDLLRTRKADVEFRDYWLLTFNKKDMKKVDLRGIKEVNSPFITNPTNDLQISWNKEWEVGPVVQPFEQAYQKVMTGLEECTLKHMKVNASRISDEAFRKTVIDYCDGRLKKRIKVEKKPKKTRQTKELVV
jgi:hypothetical protein